MHLKLERGSELQPFQDSALEFAAKKIASSTGDARKMLDICRYALQLAEKENPSSNILVTMRHMAEAIKRCLGSSFASVLQALPLHQQLVVTAVLRVTQSKPKRLTPKLVRDMYVSLCKQAKLQAVKPSEFEELANALAAAGLMALSGKTSVKLLVSEEDIQWAFKTHSLLNSLLSPM
jgi:Cdc6-like AAA superfamily ATPase